MKKIFTSILLIVCAAEASTAQTNSTDAAPVGIIKPLTMPTVNAQFDVLFNYALDTITGNNARAAVAFVNNEYWVSRWSADSLFTIDASGTLLSSFVIPGVGTAASGVRALTTDGTDLFASVNTSSIARINPVTKTLISTISCASTGITARSLSYDATANGGAGGLWVSNFGTDIFLIDLTGNILSTIPAINHGLTAMYGTAVDNFSTGGPYLWVFDQATTAGQSDIVQLDAATGTTTGITYDVLTNVGIPSGNTTGLAGGIFISNTLNPTGAIVALMQGTPSNRLVGLDLGLTVGVSEISSENDLFLTIHQNPAKDNVVIEFENYLKGKYSLQINDVAGKIVFSQNEIKDEFTTVDLRNLKSGVYFVRALGNHKVSTKKLVIE